MRRQRLTRQLRANYTRATNSRGDWPERHEERYRRYLADPTTRPAGPWPESARLFLPTTRSILERQLAQFHSALFGNPERLKLQPVGPEDAANAELASRFLRWALRKTVPFLEATTTPAISYTVIQDALIDSAGVLKIYPKHKPFKKPQTADPRRYLDTCIAMEAVDQAKFLTPPDAEGLQYPECAYVHQEIWMNGDDLVRLQNKHRPDDPFAYTVPTNPDQFSGKRTKEVTERKRAELEREGHTLDAGEGFWTLMVEAYERFDVDGDGLEEDIIVSWLVDADERYEIARIVELTDIFPVMDYPMRPFFPITVWPQSRQWRGLNVVDRLESMQDMINRLHEQMINYAEVSLIPFFFYNSYLTGDIPKNLRDIKPGEGIPVYDLNGLQIVQPRSLSQHFPQMIQMMLSHIERDSNVSDFSLGRQPDRSNAPRTFGATMALLQQGQQGFAPLIQHQGSQFAQAIGFYYACWQHQMRHTEAGRGVYAPIFDPPQAPVPQTPGAMGDLFGPMLDAGMNGMNGSQQMLGEAGIPMDELKRLSPEATDDLWRRIFQQPPARSNHTGGFVTEADLSGLYDAFFEIDPNEQFHRQVLLSLAPMIEPKLQFWPMGLRRLWEVIWTALELPYFDEIWPRAIAEIETAAIVQAANANLAGGAVGGAPPGMETTGAGSDATGMMPPGGGRPPGMEMASPPQPNLEGALVG